MLKRLMTTLLCLAMSPLPAVCAAGGQRAGQINALIPAATRNDQAAKATDEVDWNDLLKTTSSGRVRAGLDDGSILSVGSNSELRVVQHDTASQQTSLELDAGRLRSKVVKITQPNGKFEVHTPNAVIGVIGTDFYVAFSGNKTTVICYVGQVSVTPLGNARFVKQDSTNAGPGNSLTLLAGQMVEITSELPPGGYTVQSTPVDVQRSSIESTDVPDAPIAIATHTWQHVLLIGGLAAATAGVYTGVILATGNGTPKPPTTPPGKCPVPTQCGK